MLGECACRRANTTWLTGSAGFRRRAAASLRDRTPSFANAEVR
jgi:hypothetical protein